MSKFDELYETGKLVVDEPDPRFMEFYKEFLSPGMAVLDMGCGSGRHALFLAENNIKVYGIDFSKKALEILEQEANKRGLNVDLKHSDMKDMPYSSAYFDGIVCTNVLNHGTIKEIKSYLKEAFGVLKKGGFFFLIVASLDYMDFARKNDTIALEENTFVNLDLPDGDIPHHFYTEEELKELFSRNNIISLKKMKGLNPWLKRETKEYVLVAQK
jgi:cyclopropane fatty-acyl-phospholipid synthase-like methyltransferase